MGQMPEAEESDNGEDVNEPDSDASSDVDMFGFGFNKAPKPPKRRKTTEPKADKAAAGEQGKTQDDGADAASKAFQMKVSKARELDAFFQTFSPQAVWQGSQKEKDIESKLKRAMEAVDVLGKPSPFATQSVKS